MGKTCVDCKNFRGGGDFGLCCSKRYELCYEGSSVDDCAHFAEASELQKLIPILRARGYEFTVKKERESISIPLSDGLLDVYQNDDGSLTVVMHWNHTAYANITRMLGIYNVGAC